jgi:hypothetical protein
MEGEKKRTRRQVGVNQEEKIQEYKFLKELKRGNK